MKNTAEIKMERIETIKNIVESNNLENFTEQQIANLYCMITTYCNDKK